MRLATDIVFKAKAERRGTKRGYSIAGGEGGKTEAQVGLSVGPVKIGGRWFVVKISFNQGMDKTQRKYSGVSSPCASKQADNPKKKKKRACAKVEEIQVLIFRSRQIDR